MSIIAILVFSHPQLESMSQDFVLIGPQELPVSCQPQQQTAGVSSQFSSHKNSQQHPIVIHFIFLEVRFCQ